MKYYIEGKKNYTDLVAWVEEQIDYVPIPVPEDVEFHHLEDLIEIIEYGKGRCQEYTILYVSACWTSGYEARLVSSIKPDDHSWAEVKIENEWVHVDVSNKYWNDPLRRYDQGFNIPKVIAFEPFGYIDVTNKYVR